MDFSYFNNKQISIFYYGQEEDSETGLYKNKKARYSSGVFYADVQPNSGKLIYDESGKVIEYDYTVYFDKKPNISGYIKKESFVFYGGNNYSIANITEWDDYYVLLIKRADNV